MQEKNRNVSILKMRIIQYLDLKGETKSTFYKKTGISNGLLSQTGGVSEDNLLKFLNIYHDISIQWLFFGIGNPIRTNDYSDISRTEERFVSDSQDSYIDDISKLRNDYIKTANKLIQALEENAILKERLQKYEGADE